MDEILKFDSREEAQQAADVIVNKDKTYYLAHGEYERPEATVCRYQGSFAVYVKWYFYQGTFGVPDDGYVRVESRLADQIAFHLT